MPSTPATILAATTTSSMQATPSTPTTSTAENSSHVENMGGDTEIVSAVGPLGIGTDSERHSPVASEQILEDFPKLPAELRCLIYASMVNKPRLLTWSRYPYAIVKNRFALDNPEEAEFVKNALLPPSLFLNKEAYAETMRHINLVPQANENNVVDFPWSYINPKFDVFSFALRDFPIMTMAPGIQTLALQIWRPWEKFDFLEDYKTEIGLVDNLQKLPHVKEVIFLRGLGILQKSEHDGGNGLRFSNAKDEDKDCSVPVIEKHPCGFFGVFNEEIEALLAKSPPPWYETAAERPYQKPSEQVVSSLVEVLTRINDERHPGTTLPRISGAYTYWMDTEGVWQFYQYGHLHSVP